MGFFSSLTDVFGGGSVSGSFKEPVRGLYDFGFFGDKARYSKGGLKRVEIFPQPANYFTDIDRRYDNVSGSGQVDNQIRQRFISPVPREKKVEIDEVSNKTNYKTVALFVAGGVVLYMVMKRR